METFDTNKQNKSRRTLTFTVLPKSCHASELSWLLSEVQVLGPPFPDLLIMNFQGCSPEIIFWNNLSRLFLGSSLALVHEIELANHCSTNKCIPKKLFVHWDFVSGVIRSKYYTSVIFRGNLWQITFSLEGFNKTHARFTWKTPDNFQ